MTGSETSFLDKLNEIKNLKNPDEHIYYYTQKKKKINKNKNKLYKKLVGRSATGQCQIDVQTKKEKIKYVQENGEQMRLQLKTLDTFGV